MERGEGRPQDSSATGRVNTSAWALIRLAGPIFLANLSVICSSTLDTIMAGRLSAVDMAGVALGMAVASWISISLSGILQGIAPVAGFSYGAKKFREVGIELHHALILALIFCVPGVIGTAAADFWCAFAELDADAAVIARNYLWASAFALPPILLARCFISVNAAVNRPQAAMIITAVMLALKVPLNEVFMKGWGSIPAMGGAGAAVSTAILSWGALVAYWFYWKTAHDFASMRPTRRPKITLSNLESLLRIGFPIGVAGFFEMISFTMMTILLARLGESVISGHQIVANLVYLYYVLPLAIGLAGTVLVSQCLGARQPQQARNLSLRVLKVAGLCALLLGSVSIFYRVEIAHLYSNDAQVVGWAVAIIGYAAIYHFFDAMQVAGNCILRGYQITFLPMVVHALMTCCGGLGIGYILAYQGVAFIKPLGLQGFWVGSCLGLALAAFFIVPFVVRTANVQAHRSRWDLRIHTAPRKRPSSVPEMTSRFRLSKAIRCLDFLLRRLKRKE